MDIKMRINQVLTTAKDLGVFDINDEDKVRIVVENAGAGNTIVVKARIIGQSEFVTLKTITGIANETVNVSTYEEMKIECTSFSALSAVGVKLLAASFKEAGGSAIETIGVPSGDQLTDISTLTFTSSDNSISITGDNVNKSIDFTTGINDKANRNLDNLTDTSIPDGVGLNSLATSNFNIKTIDKESSTASVRISSGGSTIAGNSGDIVLSTGEVTSGNKGLVKLENNTRFIIQDDNADKLIRLQLGNGTPESEGLGQFFFNRIRSDKEVFIGAMESHVDDDGAPVVFSGTFSLSDTDGQYKTSDVSLQTLSNSGFRDADNVAVSSGNINITTHSSFVQGTETDANTGNISLNTGNPSGDGIRGNISLNGDHITVNSKQIRNLADGTASNDAVNLSQLNSAISPIEGISEIYKFYVYENNASIYADGRPGIRDTSTLIRDGWYYQNAAGQKINWYFFDGNPLSATYQGAISQSNFNAYVVMTLDSKNARPIIALYSLPTGVGDALPSFAHSRWIYQLSSAALAPLSTGKQYLFYIGANPPAHPEIPHIQLDLVPAQSIGDLSPAELILTAALNSESAEPTNDVQWMVESLGVFSPTVKQEMELRIRTVPLNSSSKIDAIYLPSFVDDVSEYANLAAFPNPGEAGKIYVALDTNKIYRWSGSQYIEISEGAIPPVLSVNTKTGDVVLDKNDIGLGNVDNTSDLDKPISNDTQDALDLKYDASNPAGYITLAEVPESAVTSVNTRTGDIFLTRVDVGLGDVDNTSDLDKPISNDTQDALDLINDAIDLITDVNWTGDYNNGTTYAVGDGVMYNGASFRMINFIGAAGYAPPAYPGSWLQVTDYVSPNDIGLGNVDNTSDLDKPISNDTQDALDDKANTNLDNLTATAIPAGVNLESVSTANFAIRTKDQPAGNSGNITIETGSTTGNRGDLYFNAEQVVLLNNTPLSLADSNDAKNITLEVTDLYSPMGEARIWSNRIPENAITNIGSLFSPQNEQAGITVFRGAASDVTLNGEYTGGNVILGSNSGSLALSPATNAAISSGDVLIATGNAEVKGSLFPNADTGNINLVTGNPEGTGTRGNISLDGDFVTVNFTQIKDLADGTDLSDAVNLSQLNNALSYSPADNSDWQAPVPDDVKEALDQLADRLQNGTGISLQAFDDMKEPTGFINRTDSTISFDDSTRIFTIAPVAGSFSFYIKGDKFTKTTAQTVTIPDSSGSHYIYFNTSGVLVSTQVFDISIIEQDAYVSLVYWNTDTTPHSRSYFAEERHGITMDGTTHAYLHTIFGARYLSGLALGGFTIGNGSLDSHAQFTSDSGSIRDEDILHVIGAQTQIPILFRQGQLWRKKAADNFPVIYSGSAGYTGANGRLPYNQYVGGAWQLTEVTSNKFVLVHYFATNDIDSKVVGIQGIAEYNDVPAARNAASTEITTLSDLPFTEFVPIGTVIFQTNTYTNAIDARIVPVNGANYMDFRGTQLYTPAGEATEHSLLSGLADDDHIQYHTDARGDARYNLKSTGDISETSFNLVSNQLNQPLVGFAFNNAVVRSFEALVSVEVDATSDLFEQFTIRGVQKPSGWSIAVSSIGDNSQVSFTITSLGQILYTCPLYAGFVSGKIKFRAITTSI